jgi:hypothetical protein
MDRRQSLMFEGIRFSIEMADVAHIRLRETLLRLSADRAAAPDEDVARVLEDAWSVVDSAHRLMGILRQAPGIKNRDRCPSIRQLLIDMAEPINALRNVFQHLDQDLRNRAHQNWPLFGIVHWFLENPDGNSGRICSLMAGTLADGERPLLDIFGKRVYEPPIGMIELQTEQASISITELMEVVKRIAADLERSIPFQGGHLACDYLIHVDIRPCEP